MKPIAIALLVAIALALPTYVQETQPLTTAKAKPEPLHLAQLKNTSTE